MLDDEPDLASNSGVVAALKMARKKGYLMENQKKEQGLGLKHLQAKNYSIDDKVGVIRGRAPKAQGRGSNFFSAGGGLIFQNRGGQGGSLQKFCVKFYRVIQINQNIEK